MSILYTSVISEYISTYMHYRLACSQSVKSVIYAGLLLNSFIPLKYYRPFFHGTSLHITHTCRRTHTHTPPFFILIYTAFYPLWSYLSGRVCRKVWGGGRVISAAVLYPLRSDRVHREYGWLCPICQQHLDEPPPLRRGIIGCGFQVYEWSALLFILKNLSK